MKLITNFMLIILILVFAGCTKYGPFSERGTTDIETKGGHKVKETVNLEDCTKTIEVEESGGLKTKRTFPMDPEVCRKEKEDKKSD